jgi:hypothetical protein
MPLLNNGASSLSRNLSRRKCQEILGDQAQKGIALLLRETAQKGVGVALCLTAGDSEAGGQKLL